MDRIIAAARREARRRTKADGKPLQGHLDAIAVEAGRRHWSDFLRAPIDIAENPLDRLVREALEDGYSGIEIDVGEHVPADLRPAVARAFRMEDGAVRIDHFRMGWDEIVHLGPAIRRRFDRPENNANLGATCLGHGTLLYNHLDVILAFEVRSLGGWNEVHGMSVDESLAKAPPVDSWWRDRVGRPLEEVVADRALHARHVRKLATILASPNAPQTRYDPYSAAEVPSCHPRLALAHFAAVADLVIPDGPDADAARTRFAGASIHMKGRRVRCEWTDRSAGLTEMTGHMVAGALRNRLTLFPDGALARALDGEAEHIRSQKLRMDREEELERHFMVVHPELSLASPEHREWMRAADLEPGAYRAWLSSRLNVEKAVAF